MKKAPKANPVEAALTLILAAGYAEAGVTDVQEFRIATTRNPVFGGIGGVATKQGGRSRYEVPGTKRRVTVGRFTTNFYSVATGKPSDFVQFRTDDLAGIAAHLKKDQP